MEEKLAAVFSLYEKWGQQNYIGENVSQLQHAQQCAIQAHYAGHGEGVVLGALLHDVGHLLGLEKSLPAMWEGERQLGTVSHELVGEEFLASLGFPTEVTQFVRGHVQAKRYLVYKDPGYHDRLSDASKGTLVCQGGPMTPGEAAAFEALATFPALLAMRDWDDMAKDPNIPATPLEPWVELARKLLQNC